MIINVSFQKPKPRKWRVPLSTTFIMLAIPIIISIIYYCRNAMVKVAHVLHTYCKDIAKILHKYYIYDMYCNSEKSHTNLIVGK